MSALEQMPHSAPERRAGVRVRLDRILPARLGRHDGIFVDLSLHGARVRHSGALLRGSRVRVGFDWGARKFAGNAEVLSSRIVTLGARDGESAAFETRVRFVDLQADAEELLAHVLRTIASDEVVTWVGNLKGFDDQPRSGAAPRVQGFIRCRRVGNGWEKKWTRDPAQPANGFTLPAGTAAAEIEGLCRAWLEMNEGARELLQLTAGAVVREASW